MTAPLIDRSTPVRPKHPDEKIIQDFDFAPAIEEGSSVSLLSVTMGQWKLDPDTRNWATTSDLTFGTPSYASPRAQVAIEGGEDDADYAVRAHGVLSDGATPSAVMILQVRAFPQ